MKNLRILTGLLLALTLLLSLGTPAFAAENTGSILISDAANVSVAGKTFRAYKILNLSLVGEDDPATEENEQLFAYSVPAGMESFYRSCFGLTDTAADLSDQVTEKISTLSGDALFTFAAQALAAAKDAGIAPAEAAGGLNETSVTMENLPLGYYVIEDIGGEMPLSALILDSTTTSAQVKIKADKPVIDKVIQEGPAEKTHSNAAVGDVVSYKITSKVPSMTGYTKYYFVVNDTMSRGLTFQNDIVITLGGATLAAGTDYTVTTGANTDGSTAMEIVFHDFIRHAPGSDITITYSAVVNDQAVIGTAGNPNEVVLTYSNNPNIKEDGTPGNPDKPTPDSPVGQTPKSEVRTYVTALEILKVNEDGIRLTGAQFQITGEKLNKVLVRKDTYHVAENGTYWKLKDGSYTTDDPNAEGMDQTKYESTTVTYAKATTTDIVTTSETVQAVGTVGTDGILRFEGLSQGDYLITELKAPDGYSRLTAPIPVTIRWEAPEDGSWTCGWTFTGAADAGGTGQIQVENKVRHELPSTGGIGTTAFYLSGSLLVLGTGTLLLNKKRRGDKR